MILCVSRPFFFHYKPKLEFLLITFTESLIDDIHLDIKQADNSLDEPKFKGFFQDGFFENGKEKNSQL